MKKFFYALAASALMLAFSDAQAAHAAHDGHAHAPHERTRRVNASHESRRASKARRRSARRAQVSYVCPMHPDMRSRSRGECPKCGMTLIAARRGTTSAGGVEAVSEKGSER